MLVAQSKCKWKLILLVLLLAARTTRTTKRRRYDIITFTLVLSLSLSFWRIKRSSCSQLTVSLLHVLCVCFEVLSTHSLSLALPLSFLFVVALYIYNICIYNIHYNSLAIWRSHGEANTSIRPATTNTTNANDAKLIQITGIYFCMAFTWLSFDIFWSDREDCLFKPRIALESTYLRNISKYNSREPKRKS